MRQYLIQQGHLEGVIDLPVKFGQGKRLGLLVLRQRQARNTVAFISCQAPHIAPQSKQDYGLPDIVQAYQAFRNGQAAHWLHAIENTAITQQAYSFYLSAYTPQVAA